MDQGIWIVLEGPDFSGTTTQTCTLHNRIFKQHKGNLVMTTREPTMRPFGMKIRELLKNPPKDVEDMGQMYLEGFVADRLDHMQNVVLKNVAEGNIVVQDRTFISTLAYQGGIQGMDYASIVSAHKDMPRMQPDALILFDLELGELVRRRARSAGKDSDHDEVFDRSDMLAKSHAAYKKLPAVLAKHMPDLKFHVIDANGDENTVTEEIMKIIQPLLPFK